MNHLTYKIDDIQIENYYDTENNRCIKVSNNSNNLRKIKILYYYSSVFFPYYILEKTFKPSEWLIADLFYVKNCSYIIVYVDDKPRGRIVLLSEKKLKKISEKIICVGLNKTGTTSLARSLKNLGLVTWADHNPIYNLNFSNYSFTNSSIGTAIDLIEKVDVDFYQDTPFSCPGVSEKIINTFPQSKYILTKRDDTQQWVKSVKNFWKLYFEGEKFTPNAIKIAQHFVEGIGELPELSYIFTLFESWKMETYSGSIDEVLAQVYENHNLSVKNTLIANNCDWIEINVSKENEFKKLTNWLNIDNQTLNFEWINKTKK
jgi:hypothetical protein